ncbi:MAG: hypothetical protein QM783_19325 [Phycisphaerales bacterium]
MIRTPRRLLRDSRRLRLSATLGVDTVARTALHAHAASRLALAAARLDAALPPGCVALVTGPSGAGKSTLLTSLANRCGSRAIVVRPLSSDADRLHVAALCKRLPLDRWAALLACFGLADAGILLGRVRDLSAGERARLAIAHAAARAEASPMRKHGMGVTHEPALPERLQAHRGSSAQHPCASAQGSCFTLIADEWCSLLDEHTTRSVACGAARWAAEHNVRLVCATGRSGAVLNNVDLLITLDGNGEGGAQWTVCTSNAAA